MSNLNLIASKIQGQNIPYDILQYVLRAEYSIYEGLSAVRNAVLGEQSISLSSVQADLNKVSVNASAVAAFAASSGNVKLQVISAALQLGVVSLQNLVNVLSSATDIILNLLRTLDSGNFTTIIDKLLDFIKTNKKQSLKDATDATCALALISAQYPRNSLLSDVVTNALATCSALNSTSDLK